MSEEEYLELFIENQRWLNDLSAKEQRKEEQERLEAEAEEQAWQEEHQRQDAIAAVRASFETGLASIGYGPFKEDIIIAHAECNLKFLPHTKEWNLEFDKYDAVKDWRAWCWSKMHGSISKGW